jgi:hypothetical protein
MEPRCGLSSECEVGWCRDRRVRAERMRGEPEPRHGAALGVQRRPRHRISRDRWVLESRGGPRPTIEPQLTTTGEVVEQDESAGTISTAWRLVGTRKAPMLVGQYIRFDIRITGGPPWRIQVVGHGGEMMDGARLMSELDGAADDMAWIVAGTNRMIVDIHKRLAPYAVQVAVPAP